MLLGSYPPAHYGLWNTPYSHSECEDNVWSIHLCHLFMSASKVDPNLWSKPISLTTITYPLPGDEWPPLGFDQIAEKASKNMRKQKHEWSRWRDSELLTLWAWGRASKAWLQVLLSLCLPWSLRFPTLEHCTTGGEALLPEEQEEWRRKTGLLLHEVYGQSETVGWCPFWVSQDVLNCWAQQKSWTMNVQRPHSAPSIAWGQWVAPDF